MISASFTFSASLPFAFFNWAKDCFALAISTFPFSSPKYWLIHCGGFAPNKTSFNSFDVICKPSFSYSSPRYISSMVWFQAAVTTWSTGAFCWPCFIRSTFLSNSVLSIFLPFTLPSVEPVPPPPRPRPTNASININAIRLSAIRAITRAAYLSRIFWITDILLYSFKKWMAKIGEYMVWTNCG